MTRIVKGVLAIYAGGVVIAAALLFWQAVEGGALERAATYDVGDWFSVALIYGAASLLWPVLLVWALPVFFDLAMQPEVVRCCQQQAAPIQQ